MFGFKFGAKKKPQEGEIVVARLNARLQPVQRGEHFEDAIDAVIKDLGLGQVSGGGTSLMADGAGIEFCDIEFAMPDTGETALQSLIAAFEELGAPKGSKLIIEASGAEHPFGSHEGLGLVLNGTELPDEVYASADINEVLAELDRLMGDDGKVKGFWEGPKDTTLYCYGPSFDAMRAAIEPLLTAHPLCQLSRVEQVA